MCVYIYIFILILVHVCSHVLNVFKRLQRLRVALEDYLKLLYTVYIYIMFAQLR